MNAARRYLLAACLLLALCPASLPAPAPAPGSAAPAFAALDASGRKRTLSEFRGRPVVLLFFCGCSRYSELARQWGDLQRGSALAMKTPDGKTPVTIAVVESSAAAMRKYLAGSGLDIRRSVLLPDPQGRLTRLYDADPGPRLFVLDRRGIVRFSGAAADAPAAQAVAARALSVLRGSPRRLGAAGDGRGQRRLRL